jgi:hypothetical protein
MESIISDPYQLLSNEVDVDVIENGAKGTAPTEKQVSGDTDEVKKS